MKTLINNFQLIYNENVKLVKNLKKRETPNEHPEQLKWALQMLYFNGEEWIQICRIDNHLHDGSIGSHIHTYGKTPIKRVKLTFDEAEKHIKRISERILKEQFHETIDFGDE